MSAIIRRKDTLMGRYRQISGCRQAFTGCELSLIYPFGGIHLNGPLAYELERRNDLGFGAAVLLRIGKPIPAHSVRVAFAKAYPESLRASGVCWSDAFGIFAERGASWKIWNDSNEGPTWAASHVGTNNCRHDPPDWDRPLTPLDRRLERLESILVRRAEPLLAAMAPNEAVPGLVTRGPNSTTDSPGS